MASCLAVYVTLADGKAEPCYYALLDGLVMQDGALILVSQRGENGKPTEGTIYAPGTWKDASFNEEDGH